MKIWINWETKEVLSGPSCVYNRIKDIENDFFSSDDFLTTYLLKKRLSRASLFRMDCEERAQLIDGFVQECMQRAVEEFERDFEQIEIPSEQDW